VAYPHGRAQRRFEREYSAESKTQRWWFGPNFSAERAERKVWQEFTRNNALFLSTAIQLNNAQLRPAFNWITQKLIVLVPGVDMNPFLSLDLLRDADEHEQIMDFMRAADIGIDRLELLEEDHLSPPAGKLTPGAVRVHLELGLPLGSPPPASAVDAWRAACRFRSCGFVDHSVVRQDRSRPDQSPSSCTRARPNRSISRPRGSSAR